MKCKQPCPGFELGSLGPLMTTITTAPRASYIHIYIYIYVCVSSVCEYTHYIYIYIILVRGYNYLKNCTSSEFPSPHHYTWDLKASNVPLSSKNCSLVKFSFTYIYICVCMCVCLCVRYHSAAKPTYHNEVFFTKLMHWKCSKRIAQFRSPIFK